MEKEIEKVNVVNGFDLSQFSTKDLLAIFDYNKIRDNIETIYSKYRIYKNMRNIIINKYSSPLSNDNSGIYSSIPSNPVENKVEQLDRYTKYIEEVDSVYNTYKDTLNKDEKVIYSKCLVNKHTNEDLMEELCLSDTAFLNRKKICYIKIALWFDLAVLK